MIGVPYGAATAYLGGRFDQWMMRLVDTLYALPFILVAILLVVVVGRNTWLLFAGLRAVYWLDIARIVTGQTLRVRNASCIAAARNMGAPNRGIILRHLLPNVAGPALVYATLTVPGIVLAESFLRFLRLGVQEPAASRGAQCRWRRQHGGSASDTPLPCSLSSGHGLDPEHAGRPAAGRTRSASAPSMKDARKSDFRESSRNQNESCPASLHARGCMWVGLCLDIRNQLLVAGACAGGETCGPTKLGAIFWTAIDCSVSDATTGSAVLVSLPP